MRKLKIVTALLLLLSIFSPGLTIAQTAPPGKTELSVDRKGVMRDPTGKVVDWRLFPFTTYADDCTKDFVKGTATKRPGKMCVDSSLLVSNDLDKKGSAQRNKLLEYMVAEPKVRRKPATLVRAKRGRRSGPTVVNRTTTVTTPPTSEQLATMEDAVFDRIANDESFRQKLAAALAKDEGFVKAIAANLPQPTPTPTPAPAAIVVPDDGEGVIAAFWRNFVTPIWWIFSPLVMIVTALLIATLLYLLLSERVDGARRIRDRYEEWQISRQERKEAKAAESALNLHEPIGTSGSKSSIIETSKSSEFIDELETIGPPLVPKGPPNVGDETEQTQVAARQTSSSKKEKEIIRIPPAEA